MRLRRRPARLSAQACAFWFWGRNRCPGTHVINWKDEAPAIPKQLSKWESREFAGACPSKRTEPKSLFDLTEGRSDPIIINNITKSLMIATEAVPKLSRNEGLKENNPTLAGTIAQTIADPAAERFTEDDYEFLKFHGIYQQDDRDKRKVAKHYMLMVRTKFPGGVLSARQYVVC